MADVWSSVGVFLLGGVGWVATSFVGRPFREFFDLRREVISKSVLYDNVSASSKELPDGRVEKCELSQEESERLHKAMGEFRDLAARMRALALNEPFAVKLVKVLRYDPMNASSLGVSNSIHRYGRLRNTSKRALEKALSFQLDSSVAGECVEDLPEG